MVAVLDFGSQYTKLIERRLRELGVSFEVTSSSKELNKLNPQAVILSGGPGLAANTSISLKNLGEKTYVLGICYGMQLIANEFGGEVSSNLTSEFGQKNIIWNTKLNGIPKEHTVWMSHKDSVTKIPDGFQILATSDCGVVAGIANNKIMALQFHPEVTHTKYGIEILKHFLQTAKVKITNKTNQKIHNEITKTVKPNEKILCAVSGGVDSTVAALVLKKTGLPTTFAFVDNGLLRASEVKEVLDMYKSLNINVNLIDAKDKFLKSLKGITDPEQKRKIIGSTFIDVFKNFIKGENFKWLAQGTVYPDVIESTRIKSHHNVGGLPKNLELKLIEPLKSLFKDEVRALGRELGVPESVLGRHPFPGPGLAIRIPGEVTLEKLEILKEADGIFTKALKDQGLYKKIWQAFCVLIPIKTVGVQGDERTYRYALSLRAVVSSDGMTVDWFEFDHKFLKKVSNLITNNVSGINRVLYDITSKPPSTIEWE